MKKNKLKFISSFIVNAHIKNKLLWIYFILIILPMIFFTVFTFTRVSDTLEKQTLTSAQKTFDDIFSVTQRTMQQLDDVLGILTRDRLIYRMSSTARKDYPVLEQYSDTQQLAEIFSHLKMISNIDAIKLYVNNTLLYSGENKNIFSLEGISNSNWYKKLMSSEKTTMWFSPEDFSDLPLNEQNCFSCVRIIYNPDSIMEPLAILRVDISKENLEKAFQATPVTEHGMAVMLKEDQPLLFSGFSNSAQPFDFSAIASINAQTWDIVNIGMNDSFIHIKELTPSGWKIAISVPLNDIYRVSRQLSTEMILVMLGVGIIAYILAYFIIRSSIRRITSLADSMKTVQNGNVNVRIEPKGEDEIGLLMNGFNDMMTNIEDLMTEKYEAGIKIKSLELQALQAQINPHFLYNSLDLVNCIAIRNNVPEITTMVGALAKFYKLSLSRGNNIITLRDELFHARLYIQIQNLRFENHIQTNWEIDESLLDCKVIKIILQPIIENAIIHGIFERDDKSGLIEIKCFPCSSPNSDKQDICIKISDNGVGMSEELIKTNFEPESASNASKIGGGYGIHNIQDRLKLAYGIEYGMTCHSTPGQGTTVTIKIPLIENSDNK